LPTGANRGGPGANRYQFSSEVRCIAATISLATRSNLFDRHTSPADHIQRIKYLNHRRRPGIYKTSRGRETLMINALKAPIDADDAKAIKEYLAKNYGS
jgi:hypothetical protein